MKCFIPLFFGLTIIGLVLCGCDSIVDQEPGEEVLPHADAAFVAASIPELTMDMCKNDPGWKALGYKNLGQCLRYVRTGTGSPPTGLTVSDVDGNVYPIVKIGEQWWMAENLKVTKYNNRDDILTGLDDTEWLGTVGGAYAIYPHDGGHSEDNVEGIGSDEEMLAAYGALYNWYAVSDSRGLCPVGWHVPSEEEWNDLDNYLGGEIIAGGKMKSTRTEPFPHPRWDNPNIDATNESGFSGLPGGMRVHEGSYINIGRYGRWWSSTTRTDYPSDIGTEYAMGRRTQCYDGKINQNYNFKQVGFPVRCIMD
jgi:uncharacterized protein (TIGR02145 family)